MSNKEVDEKIREGIIVKADTGTIDEHGKYEHKGKAVEITTKGVKEIKPERNQTEQPEQSEQREM